MKDFTDLRERVRMAQPSGGWKQVTLNPQDFLDLVGRNEQLSNALTAIKRATTDPFAHDTAVVGLREELYA